MRLINPIILLLCLIWLSSCATTPAATAPQNEDIAWDNRVQLLSNIQKWDLKGLIAIRNERDAGTASLNWQQDHQNYTLSLFGPLGVEAYKMVGGPGMVQLTDPKGKTFSAATPELLVAEQTGWQLPVSSLYYWIRGLSVPGVPAKKQFDHFHHITDLSQQGWQIHYLRYTSIDQVDLPSKIFMDYAALNIKIIISEWHFSH